MAIPISRGKPYYAKFTASLNPTENGTITSGLNIGSKYSFASGNSVIISGQFISSTRFEAIVTNYDSSTGDMTLESITNLSGTFTPSMLLQITLTGQRGSKIVAASGTPSVNTGRSGDMYVNSTTGEVFIKS